jgi:twinfilin-like protein
MLYASTRASLTRSLGDGSFTDSMHAHSPADLTSAAYRAHLRHASSSAPLTEREQELADLKAAEGVEARGTTPRGGAFSVNEEKGVLSWSEEAQAAARDLAETKEGAVHLVRACSCSSPAGHLMY